MLTADLVKPRLHKRGERLYVRLIGEGDEQRLATAADLIDLFESHIGQPRHQWNAALSDYEGERLDYIVIRGLAKVLTDSAAFTRIETPIEPAELRAMLFAQGPVFSQRDLFNPHTRKDLMRATAKRLRTSQKKLDAALFADRPAEYLLDDPGPEWTAEALIQRYNLELSRGVLYSANQMQIEIHDSFKDFWRYLKLFKLMFWATPLPQGGYQVTLDGPISPFVQHATLRYGRQFAAFLPALFLCGKWQMVATVRPPRYDQFLEYRLDYTSPLTSHFKRSGEFDSQLEADFAAEFSAKFGEKRGQWLLNREDEVILLGDTVMIPDFSFTHKQDGRRAVVEIMGFWHPNYLRLKVEKVRAAGRSDLILLVYEGVNLSPDALQDVPGEVLYFKNKPVLKDVMAAVERAAL